MLRDGAQPNDLDGDCYADVVVGAPVESAPGGYVGCAHVFLGGPGPSVDATVDGTFRSSRQRSESGCGVGGRA